MDIQLDANVENQDRAKCGKNEAGGMKSFGCRVREHVGNRAADDRPDDAEHDRPENRHVHVHHRFRDNPRDYYAHAVLFGLGEAVEHYESRLSPREVSYIDIVCSLFNMMLNKLDRLI
jgi:hypothetical protein